MVSSDVETQRDLRKAMSLEGVRREGRRIPRRCHVPDALQYSDHVLYVEQLRRYHAVFPPENVLVLIYDDFRRDNEATVRKVLRFLEVDDTSPIDTIDTKPLKSVRALRLHQLASAARIARMNPVAAGEFLNRKDGYEITEIDQQMMATGNGQLVGQFLLDRDGVVRWSFTELAEDGRKMFGGPTPHEVMYAASKIAG